MTDKERCLAKFKERGLVCPDDKQVEAALKEAHRIGWVSVDYGDIARILRAADMTDKEIHKLKEYKASTLGMFCMDFDPKDVSYEFILEHSFELKE